MLLDDLVGVIETLKERIAVHGAALRENETRTRMALIDPLLQALSWDTSDPAVVTPEYPVSRGRADYALLRPSDKPAVVLEAKKLSEGLENHNSQMVSYALEEGVAYAGLTDGDRWQIYEVFKPVPLSDKRILDVSIVNTPAHEAALKLLLLWRRNLASGQPVAANAPILATLSETPSEPSVPVPVSLDGLDDVVPPSIHEPGWTPISQVDPMIGDPPPNAIRIDRGPAANIKYWNQVLIESAEWLCGQGRLTSRECPITIGTTRNLVALTPTHTNGNNFTSPRNISTGMFVELDFTGKDFVKHTRTLLRRLGVPVDNVELRFE